MVSHPALSPKRAVGMEQEVTGVCFNSHVVVERIILAPLERFKPVDYDVTG